MSDVLPYVLHGMFNREISLWYTILTPEKVCSAVVKIKKAMGKPRSLDRHGQIFFGGTSREPLLFF